MGYKIENHPVTLRFLGAVDGKVVPSGTVMWVKYATQERATNVLIDAGSAIREETAEGKNMDGLSIPSDIDAVVETHSHTDHCGAIAEVVSKNPDAPVFAPPWNRQVINIIALEALKRSQSRDVIKDVNEWKRDNRDIVKKFIALEKKLKGGIHRSRKGRTKETKSHKAELEDLQAKEAELETLDATLCNALGITQYSIWDFLALIGKKVKRPSEYNVTEADLLKAVDIVWAKKLRLLAEQWYMTAADVEKATKKIQEVEFHTRKKIANIFKNNRAGGDIIMTMRESGHTHTVPSAQVFLEVPVGKWKKIGVLFSGDRGSSQLQPPYSQADDRGLENKADVLVLECTYGNRVHKNREEALQKLDKLVLDAIEKWEDIIFPTISLDRPMMVMYEIITRLFKKNPKLKEKVDMYYFGKMISSILAVAATRKHPMEKEIRDFWKVLSHDSWKMFTKKGKKSRFVFAGGGFLPKNGSPAWAILEFALEQPDLNIWIPNYHGGPGSNADNMIHRKEFLLTKENPNPHKLEKGQHATYIEGFSGHEDGPGLVSYARKVMKEGGTIYLNHGSEEARQALYVLLMNDPIIKQKHIRVILPTVNQEYTISTARNVWRETPSKFQERRKRIPEKIQTHMLKQFHRTHLRQNQKRFPGKQRND